MKSKFCLSKYLFLLSFFLLMISTFCGRVIFLNNILEYLKSIAIILLLFNCFIQSKIYKKNELIKIILAIVISFIVYYISKDSTILILTLLILSSKNIKFEEFIKYDFYYRIIVLIFVVSMYYLGLTEEFVLFRDGLERISFGFSHANIFGFFLSMTIVDFIYLHKNNFKFIYCLFIIPIIFVIDYYSDSRTSTIFLTLVLVFCLFYKTNIINIIYNKIFKKIISNSFLIFTIITLLAIYLYSIDNSIGLKLDNIFSLRLSYSLKFLNNYDITLFGNNLILISTEIASKLGVTSLILDNAFVHILLRYGLIVYITFAYLFNKIFKMAYIEKNTLLIIIVLLLMVYGLMETYLFKIMYNGFIMYFSKILYVEGDNQDE